MTGKATNDKRNFPFRAVADTVAQLVREGATIFQKFTCDGCGSRQTMPDPNLLYVQGRCEECGHVTDIQKTGCNYVLVRSI